MELRSRNDSDRDTFDRVVPMRCLVLGLGRTGTLSICQALRMLGFQETYHMENAVGNITDNKLWSNALAAKFEGGKPFVKKDWDRLLGHCQAVTDFPAVLFAPELIAAYPEAKVVLTERDIDKWHKSVMQTIDRHYHDWFLWLLTYVDHMTAHYGLMFYKTWFYFSKGDFATHGKQRYAEHYEEVRKLVPKDNLLTYQVGEGWEPLCGFLRVPVPDSPFPKGNDQHEFWQSARGWNRARAMAAARKASVWVVFIVVLLLALQIGRYSGPSSFALA